MPNSRSIKRQAIVIIHGIGEQRPMQTLRSFADAVRRIERNPKNSYTWSKPDTISEGCEHHRLTLSKTQTRPVTDIYELYWAHLFELTNQSTLSSWILRILHRPLHKLPRRMRSIITTVRFLSIASIIALVIWLKFYAPTWDSILIVFSLIGIAFIVVTIFARPFVRGTISDAARYLDVNPRNVEARNNVRTLGVNFLRNLHQSERNYDRIIVCGHSLGSVIGYDILQQLWYEMHEEHNPLVTFKQSAKKEMERQIRCRNADEVRRLQRNLWLEQLEMGNNWRVSDFVTMGSPLTHADILMADSIREFHYSISSHELPACLPKIDPLTKLISYRQKYKIANGKYRTMFLLRHSSMFAVTRWSNIYFPSWFGIFGDRIGGEVSHLFGRGVKDYRVEAKGFSKIFSHTQYWSGARLTKQTENDLTVPLGALRDALEIDLHKIDHRKNPLSR